MADTIQCEIHGESQEVYVCVHLAGNSIGLGFNRDEPDGDSPFPDAWCDDCEIIRAASNGWDEESERLAGIKLLCSECYERARIRNTRPAETLDDLAGLRWKCGSCAAWHNGPVLDFGYAQPHFWKDIYDKGHRWSVLPSGVIEKRSASFLDDDYCAIDDEYFFVRGLIQLPIIGSAENFNWGVWGSVSRGNFEALLKVDQDSGRAAQPTVFSWLSTRISEYPDTLKMKMYLDVQGSNLRPRFRLEPSDHPLSQEYYHGIMPARVKEIMFNRLPAMDL